MHSPLALLLLLVLTASTGAAPSKKSSDEYMVAPARDVVLWNQSQDGKINLQVSLKDVQIVALLNSDNSYDEDSSDYDYSELEALINSTIAATSTTAKPTDSEEVTSSSDDEPLLQLSDVLQIASEQEEKQKDSNNTTTLPLAFHSNGRRLRGPPSRPPAPKVRSATESAGAARSPPSPSAGGPRLDLRIR
ncbi:Hypothetical predicted protein [Cloeon dipterum]|uniref:Uncharacterized protein n=1 Tax=Cloeon dipterum TaxID=197152 RepID=A0A8S1CNC7_9INSE|nr:Hypothetical predicted protein [Cloeon dipterum]